MHDHNYAPEFLKTPKGYLTKTGFSDNINDKSIIICASNSYGKWSSMESRIEYFARKFIGSIDIKSELTSMIREIETLRYNCGKGSHCGWSEDADCKQYCPFWVEDRNKLKFSRHY